MQETHRSIAIVFMCSTCRVPNKLLFQYLNSRCIVVMSVSYIWHSRKIMYYVFLPLSTTIRLHKKHPDISFADAVSSGVWLHCGCRDFPLQKNNQIRYSQRNPLRAVKTRAIFKTSPE